MATHELKCWPNYYQDIVSGVKAFEVRHNDRDFHVWDTLHLREWDPERETYTGRGCYADVTYMLRAEKAPPDMLYPDVVVMGLRISVSYGPPGE